MNIICSSVPSPFIELMAHRTKRELPRVYPFLGSIWSTLGEYGPRLPLPKTKGSPVNSQYPVHRDSAHLYVRSNVVPFCLARTFAADRDIFHGVVARVL
jgi:hypothetical protein